jgi:hypothetical protein
MAARWPRCALTRCLRCAESYKQGQAIKAVVIAGTLSAAARIAASPECALHRAVDPIEDRVGLSVSLAENREIGTVLAAEEMASKHKGSDAPPVAEGQIIEARVARVVPGTPARALVAPLRGRS